jgi:hypothetical protein
MATVRHPAFPKVTREVEGERLAAHLAQGWVLVEPAPEPEPEPEPETAVETEPMQFNIGGLLPPGSREIVNDRDTEHVVPPRRHRRK